MGYTLMKSFYKRVMLGVFEREWTMLRPVLSECVRPSFGQEGQNVRHSVICGTEGKVFTPGKEGFPDSDVYARHLCDIVDKALPNLENTTRDSLDYSFTMEELLAAVASDKSPGLEGRYIEIQIIDDEEYEKNKNFFIELVEPEIQRGGESGEKWVVCTKSGEEIAGSPSLGEHRKMEVIIEESYEFKSTVDKLIKKANLALVVGSSSWREQFVSAVTVSAGDDDDEESSEEGLPSCCDYIMHFLTVFWKVLFAFVPPTEYWGGWACFLVSICIIGILTAVTGDLAAHFGCTVGLKDSVTAVVFVALGTSVPDTFASKVAAVQDPYADASIGNVTGSNAVNVFLGLGVAWSIASIFWAGKGRTFHVEPGSLAFSVTLFTGLSLVCLSVLLYRRRPPVGGELGGPRIPKVLTSLLFFGLWLVYILIASLEAYCHIPGF
ncbi:sodium/calcium exchanger 1-like [Lithobates pipiens]